MLIRKTANNTRTQTKILFPTPFVGVRCGKFSMFDRKNTILGSKHTCLAVRFVILVKKCQFYKIRSPSGDTRCYSSIYLFSIVAKHPSVTSWSLPTKIKYPAKKNGQLNLFYNHELGLLKKWVYIYIYVWIRHILNWLCNIPLSGDDYRDHPIFLMVTPLRISRATNTFRAHCSGGGQRPWGKLEIFWSWRFHDC